VFRRIQISLNSQLVDDLDYCGRRATTEVYQSASPSWYDTVGTIMGAWKLTQGEFIQPTIIAPVSSAAGGSKVSVSTIPVKSRVQALQFANYSHQLALASTGSGNAIAGATFTVAAGTNPGTVPANGNMLIVPPGGYGSNPAPVLVNGQVYEIVLVSNVPGVPDLSLAAQAVITTAEGGAKTLTFSSGFASASGWQNGTITVQTAPANIPAAAGVSPAISAGQLYISRNNAAELVYSSVSFQYPSVAAGPLVVPTAGMGQSYNTAAQVASNGQGCLGNAVWSLTKIGHTWPSPNAGVLFAPRPIALAPDYTAAVSRTDVLSKLYATSAFMKDVFFGRNAGTPTTSGSWNIHPANQAAPSLEGIGLNTGAQALWIAKSDTKGPKFSVPMGLLSHLFRQEQLFPLRNAGQLIIQIQFADALECCYAGWLYPQSMTAANPGVDSTVKDLTAFQNIGAVQIGYQVTNLELECDIVTAIPEYTAILDAIC
jgi:hypothetical protein